MTNEELLADLKQFIEATVSQQMSNFATKDNIAELKAGIKALDHKLDEIQDAIADTLTHATDVTNESISGVENVLEDHEKRIKRLEQRSA